MRGLLLSALAMAALVFGFEALGPGLLARHWVVLMNGVGVVCGGLYLRHSQRYAEPLLDLKLLRIPSYGISFWGGNLLRLGTSSLPFLLVLMFQLCFGLSPLQAGLLTLAGGEGAFLMKLLAVRVVRRFGIRRTLISKAVLTGLTLAACASFTSTTPYSVIVLMCPQHSAAAPAVTSPGCWCCAG